MEHQTLGRRLICPILHVTQRIKLEIDGFLVNTTLSQKYGDPKLESSIYGAALKCSLYNPVSQTNYLTNLQYHLLN